MATTAADRKRTARRLRPVFQSRTIQTMEEIKEEKNALVREIADKKYEYGFTTDVETDIIPVGLNEDIVRLISQKKHEPEWMLEFRLRAFRHWQTLKQPTWGHVHIPPIDYQAISYYADPLAKKPQNKEIDPELEKTFDKLGIPLEERLALSGTAVDAIMDSVSVKTTFKEKLAGEGRDLLLHRRGHTDPPGPRQAVSGHGRPLRRQLLCRAQLGGVLRRILRLYPQGCTLPDGTEQLFPHQRPQHGTV